jgi:ATP-binding cassette subfamily F protein 3
MISLKNVTLWFGSRNIFNNINIEIGDTDKIGLTGKNGEGKSTLLKIIAGEITPDSGIVSLSQNSTIGYLPQHLTYSDSTTVIEETQKAFEEVNSLKKEYESLSKNLESRTDYDSDEYIRLASKLSDISERLAILDANKTTQLATQVLKGLGFKESDLTRKTSEFSGGWRMRIEIAKILLKQPKILLLDEPTNHLDIESIIWLENFLKTYKGAIILISHDIRFLDSITQRTIEISKGKIYDYPVPYSKYKELRKQRIEHQKSVYENQMRKIKQTERFIERFRYKATKASQVQSRVKQLEKLELPEIEEEDTKTIHFSFPPAPRSGDIVVELESLSKSYGTYQVLKDIDFILERGEKVAFVGKNGEGKTTLARIIVGELDYNGKKKIGHNVKIGYFAQNQEQTLNPKKTVLETIIDVSPPDMTEAALRTVLGNFLFSEDDIDKKVSVLSGGEKARLVLACMILQPYNLLVLDEPTNHLDIYAKERLKAALNHYNGTLIIVSHDREFLKGLVNTVYEFHNHTIKQYKGDIDFFLSQKKAENFYELEKGQIKNNPKQSKTDTDKELKKQNYQKRKELQRLINKTEKEIQNTENQIEKTEKEIKELETKFSTSADIESNMFEIYNNLKTSL